MTILTKEFKIQQMRDKYSVHRSTSINLLHPYLFLNNFSSNKILLSLSLSLFSQYLESITPARSTVVTNGNLAIHLITVICSLTASLLCTWWNEEPRKYYHNYFTLLLTGWPMG
jgi:hypothetical protein